MTQDDLGVQKTIQVLLKMSQDIVTRFNARLEPQEREALEEMVERFPAYLKPDAEGVGHDSEFKKHLKTLEKKLKDLTVRLKHRKPVSSKR